MFPSCSLAMAKASHEGAVYGRKSLEVLWGVLARVFWEIRLLGEGVLRRVFWRLLRGLGGASGVLAKMLFRFLHLAGQCELPPHIAQYPFEIVLQRGVSHALALFP